MYHLSERAREFIDGSMSAEEIPERVPVGMDLLERVTVSHGYAVEIRGGANVEITIMGTGGDDGKIILHGDPERLHLVRREDVDLAGRKVDLLWLLEGNEATTVGSLTTSAWRSLSMSMAMAVPERTASDHLLADRIVRDTRPDAPPGRHCLASELEES